MKKQAATSSTSPRSIDLFLTQYAGVYQKNEQRTIMLISSYMLIFGLLGLLWSTPFPHLNWLGRYNGYVNWASFFIAIMGYYYYRLSPVVGYPIILLMLLLTYFITCLQIWETNGGVSMKLICSLLIATALLMLLLINKRLRSKLTVGILFTNILIAPAYGAQLVFKRFGVRY